MTDVAENGKATCFVKSEGYESWQNTAPEPPVLRPIHTERRPSHGQRGRCRFREPFRTAVTVRHGDGTGFPSVLDASRELTAKKSSGGLTVKKWNIFSSVEERSKELPSADPHQGSRHQVLEWKSEGTNCRRRGELLHDPCGLCPSEVCSTIGLALRDETRYTIADFDLKVFLPISTMLCPDELTRKKIWTSGGETKRLESAWFAGGRPHLWRKSDNITSSLQSNASNL